MSIKVYATFRKEPVEFKSFTFSGGEVQVKVGADWGGIPSPITIEAELHSSNDIMELVMTADAIRRRGTSAIHLVCKYLPYARQDRVMNAGEALGLKVMCDLINSLKFASVEVWDVHSDTALALLDKVKHVTQTQLVRLVPVFTPDIILVSPDGGSLKKTFEIAKAYGREMVTAEKHRSVQTGEITETKVHSGDLGGRPVLIVDDICDGGRTFIELAKVLQKEVTTGKIYLYVTHGIFSKGLNVFRDLFEHVFVANPFPGVDLTDPIISKLNIPSEG